MWLGGGGECVAGKGKGMCGWEGEGDVWLGRGKGYVAGKRTGMCGWEGDGDVWLCTERNCFLDFLQSEIKTSKIKIPGKK